MEIAGCKRWPEGRRKKKKRKKRRKKIDRKNVEKKGKEEEGYEEFGKKISELRTLGFYSRGVFVLK